MELGSNNLSNNEVASGNFSPKTTINLDGILNGSEKMVALLFPSVRNVMIERLEAEIERYKTETERHRIENFLKIGLKAQEIVNILGIKVEQIPPKIALPLFEKSSLEHEEEMYNAWAELLVAASDEYNPIQIQYAEILSKIGHREERVLLEIYTCQRKINVGTNEKLLHEALNKLSPVNSRWEIKASVKNLFNKAEQNFLKKLSPDNIKLRNIVKNSSKRDKLKLFIGERENWYKILSQFYIFKENEEIESIISHLRLLKLAEVFMVMDEQDAMAPIEQVILLTDFGYKFVETLEKYNIKRNKHHG